MYLFQNKYQQTFYWFKKWCKFVSTLNQSGDENICSVNNVHNDDNLADPDQDEI